MLCCHSITKITRNGINGAMFVTDTLDAAIAFVVVVADRRGARRRRLHHGGGGGGLEGHQHQNNSGHLHFLAEMEMRRFG